ncbi:MAG: hypothetical protein HYY40_05435 [Bacteroidetes bacterium]|nr:hypothetical protein [Bacteroidota bacterium]
MKYAFFIFLYFCNAYYIRSSNHPLIVKEFNGDKKFSVIYKYKPLAGIMTIYLLMNNKTPIDSFISRDILGIDTLEIKKEKFICLSVVTRGGSNTGYKQLYVMTVEQGQFCESLHIYKMSKLLINELYRSGGIEKVEIEEMYEVSDSLVADRNEIILGEKYVGKFSNEPEKDNEWVKSTILKFDAVNMIFYTDKIKLDTVMLDEKILQNNGEYFVIKLKEEIYIFYNNRWYGLNPEANTLIPF